MNVNQFGTEACMQGVRTEVIEVGWMLLYLQVKHPRLPYNEWKKRQRKCGWKRYEIIKTQLCLLQLRLVYVEYCHHVALIYSFFCSFITIRRYRSKSASQIFQHHRHVRRRITMFRLCLLGFRHFKRNMFTYLQTYACGYASSLIQQVAYESTGSSVGR